MHKIPESLIIKLATLLDLTATFENRGQGWRRIYLRSKSDGFSRAMILVRDGYYSHAKWYDSLTLSEDHYYRYAFHHLMETGYLVVKESWPKVVAEAQSLAESEYQEKLKWRRDNPKKHGSRARITVNSGHKFMPQLIPVLCDLRHIVNFGIVNEHSDRNS